jgi:hypothetical protein
MKIIKTWHFKKYLKYVSKKLKRKGGLKQLSKVIAMILKENHLLDYFNDIFIIM